jgi:hypothetical protein
MLSWSYCRTFQSPLFPVLLTTCQRILTSLLSERKATSWNGSELRIQAFGSASLVAGLGGFFDSITASADPALSVKKGTEK